MIEEVEQLRGDRGGGVTLAYRNDPQLREHYLERMRAHAAADEIIQGTYWEHGRGCAVGCLMESAEPHERMEAELGIPQSLAYLADGIFEGLPAAQAKTFAVDFPTAIQAGADLSLVVNRFLIWLLQDLEQYAQEAPEVLACLHQVRDLHERVVAGGVAGGIVSADEWAAASAAAEGAARAAWAAARAAADVVRDAAWATWDAASATGDATWGAAAAATRAATRDAARDAAEGAAEERQASKLLEALRAAPVEVCDD